jgi:hypothetical protein
MSEFSHQAGISKLRDKVAILPRHGVRHPHEEVSGVQEGEAVRLPPMSLIIVKTTLQYENDLSSCWACAA